MGSRERWVLILFPVCASVKFTKQVPAGIPYNSEEMQWVMVQKAKVLLSQTCVQLVAKL